MKNSTIIQEKVSLTMSDGFVISAHVYKPISEKPKALIVLCSATGVRQQFYMPFCNFLAQQGFIVWTSDYRGIGESAPTILSPDFEAGPMKIAEDLEEIIHFVFQMAEQTPIFTLGHSLGGIFPMMIPSHHRLAGMFTVGTQVGYYADWSPYTKKWTTFFQWYILMPLLTKWFGYFPGRKIGGFENLPATFVRDFTERVKYPDFEEHTKIRGANFFVKQINCPVMALAATDDHLTTPKAFARVFGKMSQRIVEYCWLKPSDFGLKTIGHFNFFRKSSGSHIWRLASDWFTNHLENEATHYVTDEEELYESLFKPSLRYS